MLETSAFNEIKKYRVIILTALKLEYKAVRKHLQIIKKEDHSNINFEIGSFSANDQQWEVIICETGMGNAEAANVTTLAIKQYRPDLVIFVGIGGGLKDVAIKDVVIATQVYNFESAKVTETEHLTRPKGYPIDPELERIAQDIERAAPSGDFSIIKGTIVSGEKVLASIRSSEVELIQTRYNDAVAIDMEGYGFSHSAYTLSTRFILIRGISDKLSDKTAAKDEINQPIAISNASLIAFEFLKRYKPLNSPKEKELIIQEIPQLSQIERSNFSLENLPNESAINLNIITDEIPITLEYHKELDSIRESLLKYQPTSALEQLQALNTRIFGTNLNVVKYRILSYQGAAYLQLKKISDAGRSFIEAHVYNPSDENAQINAAYGYFLLADYPKALSIVRTIIEKSPVNTKAISISIHIRSINENLDEIIASIPNYLAKTREVALVIGCLYHSKHEFEKSICWLKIANDPQNKDPQITSILASSIVNSFKLDKNTLGGRQLQKEHINTLNEAESLFSITLDLVKLDRELQKVYSYCLVERGFIQRILGNKDDWFEDIIEAYRLFPEDPVIILHRSLVYFDQENYHQAEKLLKSILFNEATPNSIGIYLETLKRQRKFSDAINCIEIILKKIEDRAEKDELLTIKIDIYLESGKEFFPDAEKIAFFLFEEDKDSIESRYIYARTLRRINKTSLAKEVLDKIDIKEIEKIPPLIALGIADEFFYLGCFKKAADIYVKIIDTEIPTLYTIRYIESLYHFDKLRNVLEVCRKLHSKGNFTHFSVLREMIIDEEIGNLSAAREICSKYLISFPDDLSMQYNLAVTNFKLQNFSEVDRFLSRKFTAKECELKMGIGISRMLLDRHKIHDSIELAYDLRREYYDKPEAHENYILIFLNSKIEKTGFNVKNKVEEESAVLLRNTDTDEKYFYVIESRDDLSSFLKERSINDPFIKKIIGKKKGEKISIGDPPFEREIEIVDVLNKYIHAFQESYKNYNRDFPLSTSVKKIQIKSIQEEPTQDQIEHDFILPIKSLLDAKQDIINLYYSRQIPISAIANRLKIPYWDLFTGFSQSSDFGINCSSGEKYAILVSAGQIKKGKRLILEISSLYTITSLDIGNLFVSTFGKFLITQAVIEDLRDSLKNLQNSISQKEHMILVPAKDTVTFVDAPIEEYKRQAQNIERILSWINENCKITPCFPLLDLSQSEIDKQKLLGKSALDAIYLSSNKEHLLFSDDKILSLIAQAQCQGDTISIQDILTYFHMMGIINEAEHIKLVNKLFDLNYFYINFDLLYDPCLLGCISSQF